MDVQLELLKGQRATVGEPERNPFRFQPKAAAPRLPHDARVRHRRRYRL
jgi:hypothetical protein